MTDYSRSDGDPVELRLRVRHPSNPSEEEQVLLYTQLTDIVNGKEIVVRMPTSGGTRGFFKPILVGLSRIDLNAGYGKFNNLLVTARFRRRAEEVSRDG